MNKIIITRWNDRILTSWYEDQKMVQVQIEDEENRSILNNIYIAKVKNIVKNINAAFVELGGGQMAYYSLTENKIHHHAVSGDSPKLRAGDEIIVQVSKDAIKTKDPVVTGVLSFPGKYSVVTAGKTVIGFSGKISDTVWKQQWKERLLKEGFGSCTDGHSSEPSGNNPNENLGVILRTNAKEAAEEDILKELEQLKQRYRQIMETGAHRTCYSLLYEAAPACVNSIRDTYHAQMEEILTDDPEIFRQLQAYLQEFQPEDAGKLHLYEDDLLPLSKLYQIDKWLEDALNRRVWLKSGGYLVIEPTEALTVIDVNTGKYSEKKSLRETILKINLEAAMETARQLRLRNLSGIIIIDFIDMEQDEDRQLLMRKFSEWCSKDPVRTHVVDLTKLNLVEVTRKKIRKPLHELMKIQGDKRR